MIFLTRENAPNAVLVRDINDHDRGTLRFNYNARRLASGRLCSTVGPEGNDHLLPWQEYGHWEVVSFRQKPPVPAAAEKAILHYPGTGGDIFDPMLGDFFPERSVIGKSRGSVLGFNSARTGG